MVPLKNKEMVKLLFDRTEQFIFFHEFVWESKYTKKCQDEHLFSSESQKIERKKQLQIENSGFLKPYHEQIKYKITKNSFRVKNIFCDFLQKKTDPTKVVSISKNNSNQDWSFSTVCRGAVGSRGKWMVQSHLMKQENWVIRESSHDFYLFQ